MEEDISSGTTSQWRDRRHRTQPKPKTEMKPENFNKAAEGGSSRTTCSRLPFDEECVWHFALRYALPRQSTASTIVAEVIRANMHRIDPRTLRMMGEEIHSAIMTGNAGASIDVTIWRRLQEDIHYFENVRVMATPLARANVDRGMKVEITWRHY